MKVYALFLLYIFFFLCVVKVIVMSGKKNTSTDRVIIGCGMSCCILDVVGCNFFVLSVRLCLRVLSNIQLKVFAHYQLMSL